MIKEIKYTGFSAQPSDYECQDGELAMSLNLVPENGAVSPLFPPEEVLQLNTGETVMFIHTTSAFKHYIILTADSNLKWLNDGTDESTATTLRKFTTTIYQVTAVGNTLVVLAADGMHYFLWKGESNDYLYLGTEIPECPLSFGLQCEMVAADEFDITFDDIAEDALLDEFSDDNKTKITSQVLAKVNKFIADNSTNTGKFIYPFLVRYAYRLYDGSLTMHSAPVLMIASSAITPLVLLKRDWSGTGQAHSFNNATLQIIAALQKLDFATVAQSYIDKLSNWKDIVRSIDIFISKPIYTYDQNGECPSFGYTKEEDGPTPYDSYSICLHTNQAADTATYPTRYQYNEFSKLYAFTFEPDSLTFPSYILKLPDRGIDDVKSDIKSCSNFYFLESIKIEQLSTERKLITVEDDYLQSLVAREVMTDDYDSHDRLIPQYAFSYNSRLSIANLKKVLFNGYNAKTLYCFSNGYVANYDDTPTKADHQVSVCVYVFIKQDGKDIVVKTNNGEYGVYGNQAPLTFFYYPNINAYKAVIARTYYTITTYYEIPLEKHDFLNGAFYFNGWNDLSKTVSDEPTVSTYAGRTVNVPNKIYTSEVNNPFYFPVLGINTVGTGTILGICAAAKALSQGQFGQFPLYAFTSEGVWALEVSSTGTYSAKQPITRDVVINSESITQIDSAVLFATDRGIMHISGSTVQCLSDTLNADTPFSIADLPKAEALISIFNGKADESEQITLKDITLLPFSEFIADCRMVYDYTNQHIIVYNPAVRYAYVYSLKSQMWGMMRSDIVSNVNSYPEALAMADGAKLVNFSKSGAESIAGLLVTRPLKLDLPDILKTIDTIIQRGHFRRGHLLCVLFASRDLFNWHLVWSSNDHFLRGFRGTPYKYFRIACIASFAENESVLGASVKFTPRLTNQPR